MKERNCRDIRGQSGNYHIGKTEKYMAIKIYFIAQNITSPLPVLYPPIGLPLRRI
jgi:hypothetical protein